MERYFYNNDALNDVKNLKAKIKQFDRQSVEWRKILEGKAIMNGYKCVLSHFLDKANETYGHPKRKRDNVTIIDPQYRLFLDGLNEHAIAYAAERENENGVPAYIRYEAKHGSKGELGHEERRRKTKHCVERLDSQHVGRAQRVEKDKGKFVDRDDHNKNKCLYWEPDQSINRPTQNQNVGVDKDRIIHCLEQNWNTGIGQDQMIHRLTPNRNVGVDQVQVLNRSTQKQNAGVDQDRVVSRPTQNQNAGVDQDRVISCPTQNQNAGVDQDRLFNSKNRNVGVDKDQVFNRPTLKPDVGVGQDRIIHLPTQNSNVGVDQDRRINRLTQNQNAVIDQDRIFNRLTRNRNVGVGQERLIIRPTQNWNTGVNQDQIFKRSAQNRNVSVDQDRIINCLTQNRNVGVNQDREITRPTQYQNVDVDQDQIINQYVGVDQDRKVNRSKRNRNVGVDQDRVITHPAQYQNMDVYQDRPTQNQNVGVDQDREINRPTQNRNVGVDHDRPVAKNKSSRLRKVKCREKVYEDKETKPTVRVNSENLGRKSGRGNNQVRVDCCERANQVQPIKKEKVQGDNGLLCLKTDLKDCAAKDRLVRKVKAQPSRKRAHCDSDVEILDDDAFHKKLTPFVHSKPFQICMEVDDMDCHHFGSKSSTTDVFREKLVDVLKKPFDKDELKRLGDDVRNGLYYVYYPDLQRKLSKYRYKKGKRLNILRGFLFWLQNVSQQGSFKPWKDRRCIAVEPGPPENFPPPRSANPNCAKQSKRKILK